MDHQEAREILDVAAVEPGGLDRLIAGDTPTANALAGHLAGCDECTEEFARLRRSTRVLRDVIATQPPADLRDRTLALIAAVGRDRTAMSPALAVDPQVARDAAAVPVPPLAAPADAPVVPVPIAARRPRRRVGAWAAAIAAALVIASAGLTAAAVATVKDSSARQASLELEGLTEVARWTAHLDAAPDVQRVVLTGATPTSAAQVGTLIFSSDQRQIVVVADGLGDPAPGREYRCWVEVDGSRQRLGRMYMSGSLAYWVGDSDALANVPAGSKFGVSLADTTSSGGGTPVLSGTLRAS